MNKADQETTSCQSIIIMEYLTKKTQMEVQSLLQQCQQYEQVECKLELDYKLASAQLCKNHTHTIAEVNEFLYYQDQVLIGYIGICGFAGTDGPLEMTGMVHPNYRRKGIFRRLSSLAFDECKRRGTLKTYLLCDRKSESGQAFITSLEAAYEYSEYEMYLNPDADLSGRVMGAIHFEKATNADTKEIARQNSIYFNEPLEDVLDTSDELMNVLLPEEEEKKGMTIYLAYLEEKCIGKVHLQCINGLGGIYGLGVIPEERGKGYGRAILCNAVTLLKEQGASQIMLQVAAENDKALGLYQSCGFNKTSIMDYYVN